VPDVAGDASPESGYNILVDGQQEVVGGTSAVAPLWAALIYADQPDEGTPVGVRECRVCMETRRTFHDITRGIRVVFRGAADGNACTGWGRRTGRRSLGRWG